MLPYRTVNNTASHFTHHTSEAAARADFDRTVENGCTEGWSEFDRQCVRNLLTIHYDPQSRRRITFNESPLTAQELRELTTAQLGER